jgi:hypothetical protein
MTQKPCYSVDQQNLFLQCEELLLYVDTFVALFSA